MNWTRGLANIHDTKVVKVFVKRHRFGHMNALLINSLSFSVNFLHSAHHITSHACWLRLSRQEMSRNQSQSHTPLCLNPLPTARRQKVRISRFTHSRMLLQSSVCLARGDVHMTSTERGYKGRSVKISLRLGAPWSPNYSLWTRWGGKKRQLFSGRNKCIALQVPSQITFRHIL